VLIVLLVTLFSIIYSRSIGEMRLISNEIKRISVVFSYKIITCPNREPMGEKVARFYHIESWSSIG
jgi:hypothetical protein